MLPIKRLVVGLIVACVLLAARPAWLFARAPAITELSASPNPAKAGQIVTVKVSGTGACAFDLSFGVAALPNKSGLLSPAFPSFEFKVSYKDPGKYFVIVKGTGLCKNSSNNKSILIEVTVPGPPVAPPIIIFPEESHHFDGGINVQINATTPVKSWQYTFESTPNDTWSCNQKSCGAPGPGYFKPSSKPYRLHARWQDETTWSPWRNFYVDGPGKAYFPPPGQKDAAGAHDYLVKMGCSESPNGSGKYLCDPDTSGLSSCLIYKKANQTPPLVTSCLPK